MENKFDPYEVLGVDRDASTEEIKAVGKKTARELHPDAGGDTEAFAENRRALSILMSPTKRAKFDRTGSAEEEPWDAKMKKAMQVIHSALASLTNEYLTSDFDPQKDPRKMDLIFAVSAYLRDQIATGQRSLETGKRHEAFLRDFVKRFKQRRKVKGGPQFDFIARQFEEEIKAVLEKLEMVESDLEVAALALDMIKAYEFKMDPPEPPPPPPDGWHPGYGMQPTGPWGDDFFPKPGTHR